ncbi:MAG: hypothetical protein MUF70_05685 [Myxococcota bacterium]|nr:hypothetical protein [Myxococcota bacterium]
MEMRGFDRSLAHGTRASSWACAALLSLALAGPASADQTEAEVGVPEPEAAAEAAPEPPAEPVSLVSGDAPPPLSSEPIDAVHRPHGFWGPVAIAADLLVMRPVGLVSLVAGGAAFVVVSPVAAATGTLGDRLDTLGDRAENVFTRPLGAL